MVNRHINSIYAIAVCLTAMAFLFSCTHDVRLQTDAVRDRAAMPALQASEVTTLISDSGVTRYRITAPSWQVYDRAQPPYWEFADGIYLEQFDEDLTVKASLQSDYAYYDEDAQQWRLEGNVRSLNREGEEFTTPQLFWNQRTERVFSDSAITIKKSTSVIHGIGFESNQEMTKYTIRKPTGIIPVNE